jgi:FixJ family two-component response regulator
VSRSVLVLDDDDDLREALTGMVEFLGHQCVGAASLDELRAQSDAVQDCGVAIVDINLGADQPSGIDAYDWLKQQRFAGSVVFLTGHARSHPLVQQACQRGDVKLLEKPIGAAELRAILDSDGH